MAIETDFDVEAICAMAYVEMLNISAILHANKNTERLLRTSREDSPSGVQITGKTVDEFERVARRD